MEWLWRMRRYVLYSSFPWRSRTHLVLQFRKYLIAHGYDVSQMGLKKGEDSDAESADSGSISEKKEKTEDVTVSTAWECYCMSWGGCVRDIV